MNAHRQQLEKSFSHYQAILGDRATEQGKERIEVTDIVHDYYAVDDEGRITIKYVSKKEPEVFYTIVVDKKQPENTIDIAVPLCEVSDSQLNNLVEMMRKAMIIEELRNTYIDHETPEH